MDTAEISTHDNASSSVTPTLNSGLEDSFDPPFKDPAEQADAFLQQHGGEIHEALDAKNVNPSPEQLRFSRQPTLDVSNLRHVELFREAIKAYQKESQDKNSYRLDLKEDTTWPEVLKLAKNVEKTYRAAGEKRMRKIGRWITDRSEAAIPVLRCIPNDPFYTNILSGGLRIVFELTPLQSASRISQNRDNVLETLLRIPHAIELAERCVLIVPDDPMLCDRTMKVFLTALTAIEGTVKWLGGSPTSKALKALFQGTFYTKSLSEKKQALENALGALEEYLSTLNIELLVESGKSINSIKELVSETNARLDGVTDIDEFKKEAREAMKLMLTQTLENAKWRFKQDKYLKSLQREVRMLQASAAAMTSEDVLKLIGGGLEHRTFDLQSTLRACEAASRTNYETAIRVIQEDMLQQWLQNGESSSLFIEGGLSMTGHGRGASPLSNVCSMLIESLDRDPEVPLWFFCGAHSSPRDAFRGPQGLMRSLISQVLSLFTIKLDFISTPRYRQWLESCNLLGLCDFFEKLMRRIEPPSVVICIIDEISMLESSEWAESCKHVLWKLHGLVNDADVDVTFKLLVTSSDRSRYAMTAFPPECHLKMGGREVVVRNEVTERQIHIVQQRTRHRAERKQTIETIRKRSLTGTWNDTSGDDSDSGFDLGIGGSHIKRQRTIEQIVVDTAVELD